MTPDTDVLFKTPHVDEYRVAKEGYIAKCITFADTEN